MRVAVTVAHADGEMLTLLVAGRNEAVVVCWRLVGTTVTVGLAECDNEALAVLNGVENADLDAVGDTV